MDNNYWAVENCKILSKYRYQDPDPCSEYRFGLWKPSNIANPKRIRIRNTGFSSTLMARIWFCFSETVIPVLVFSTKWKLCSKPILLFLMRIQDRFFKLMWIQVHLFHPIVWIRRRSYPDPRSAFGLMRFQIQGLPMFWKPAFKIAI